MVFNYSPSPLTLSTEVSFALLPPSSQGFGLCPLGWRRSDTRLTTLYYSCGSNKNAFYRIAFSRSNDFSLVLSHLFLSIIPWAHTGCARSHVFVKLQRPLLEGSQPTGDFLPLLIFLGFGLWVIWRSSLGFDSQWPGCLGAGWAWWWCTRSSESLPGPRVWL